MPLFECEQIANSIAELGHVIRSVMRVLWSSRRGIKGLWTRPLPSIIQLQNFFSAHIQLYKLSAHQATFQSNPATQQQP
jgi:hypothetical protein